MVRLLLADDHPIILSGVQAVLRGTNYEVVAALHDGAAVLDFLETETADLLLLDVRMPKRSGLDILRILRSRRVPAPVVLLTANVEDSDLIEAIQTGVNGIVLKESAQELLLECLERVLAGGRWIDKNLLERALDAAVTEPPRPKGARLSAREQLVMKLVAAGRRNREIADELKITEGTVKVYLHRLYQRMGVSNRTELAMHARDLGVS
ncbi:MAG TPA: response regulator transcription factor [Allosphingosinicella sp.]|uniref:response regulator transcription factor n=1 Tax=Allosphingosinicella sp. TaxID=2823234 RepID=UPI002EDA4070